MKKTSKRKKAGTKRQAVIAAGIILFLCAATGFAIWRLTLKEEGAVCHVDGEPVYEKEIALSADSVWLEQEQTFAEKTGQEIGRVDLSIEADGKTGYEYLADAVEDKIICTKVLEIEAQKNGLCDEISYPEIEKARQKQNADRQERKAEGGVVYGVMSFEEEEYFSYFIENLNLQNERYLIKQGKLKTTEAEVREFYENDPSAFDNQPYETVAAYVENAVLSRKYETYMDKLEEKAEVKGKDRIIDCLKEMGY